MYPSPSNPPTGKIASHQRGGRQTSLKKIALHWRGGLLFIYLFINNINFLLLYILSFSPKLFNFLLLSSNWSQLLLFTSKNGRGGGGKRSAKMEAWKSLTTAAYPSSQALAEMNQRHLLSRGERSCNKKVKQSSNFKFFMQFIGLNLLGMFLCFLSLS